MNLTLRAYGSVRISHVPSLQHLCFTRHTPNTNRTPIVCLLSQKHPKLRHFFTVVISLLCPARNTVAKNLTCFPIQYTVHRGLIQLRQPIPVAEQSTARVGSPSLAGVAGSNLAGGHGCLCCECCTARTKGKMQNNQNKEVRIKYREKENIRIGIATRCGLDGPGIESQ